MNIAIRRSWTIVLFALAAAMAGCGGKQERLAAHMEKGKTYYDQANYDKAKIEVGNVLQIDPKNSDAYFLLGLIDEEQQDWQHAFSDYSKAVQLDPDQIQANVKLGRLHVLAGRLTEAEAIMTKVLVKRPSDPGGRFLKAALLVRKGQIAAATQEATDTVAANPTHTDAVSLLAGLYAQQGNEARAEQVLETGIQANPNNIALHIDLAAVAVRRHEMPKAEKAYLDVIAIQPQSMRYRVALADLYVGANQLDKAEKVLRDAVQADPKDIQRSLSLVEFLAVKRGADQAEKELLSAIQANPAAYALRFRLAKLYESMRKPAQAEQTYRDIIAIAKARPEGLKSRVLLARDKVATGDAAEAEKLLAEVLTDNRADSDALRLRGQMSLARGDAKASIPDFRVVLRDHPESIEVMNMLAAAHRANGEPQLAKDVYNNAIVRYPNNANVRVALANFLVASKDYDGALKELDIASSVDSRNARAYLLKADVQIARKDLRAAEETLRKLKAALPSQPVGDYRLGMLYLVQKKLDQASGEFESALTKAPDAIEPLDGVIAVLLEQGKPDKAIARINQAIQLTPRNARAYSLLANVYARQKKYDDAETALRKAAQIDQRSPVPYLSLANFYSIHGDTTAAEEILQQGARADLTDPLRVPYALAATYQQAGDWAKAIAEYDKILEKNPDADQAANNLAVLLSENKGNKANLDRALALAKRFENASNPSFLDTLGWVYFQRGDNEHALPLLQRAVNLAPKAPDLQYHFGMALYEQGDVKSAKTHLQLAVDSKAKFVGLDEASATLAKM